MPRYVLPALIAAAVALAFALTWWTLGRAGGGEVGTAEHDLAPFRRIDVSGAAEVVLRQGATEHVSVETPARGLRIVAEVRDGRLSITRARHAALVDLPRRSLGGEPHGARRGHVSHARVAVAQRRGQAWRRRARHAGAAAVGRRRQRRAHRRPPHGACCGSTARVRSRRRSRDRPPSSTSSISGAGEYQAESLASERATINVSGVGHVIVRVEKDLSASISGAGSVEYHGNPAVKERVSGMGRVKRIDSPAPARGVKVAGWPVGGAFAPCLVL